ncbi:hypothetical protein K8T06_13535 [bacterium]|nr:hypothetical protein [bacterium]
MSNPSVEICANCGMELKFASGYRVSRCTECGELNLVLMENGIYNYLADKQINGSQALGIACCELGAEKTVDNGFIECMRKESETFLYFVPSYDCEGLATVRFKIRKYRNKRRLTTLDMQGRIARNSGEIDLKSVRYDTRITIQEFHHKSSAVAGLCWGIEHVDLPLDHPVETADLMEMQRQGTVLSPNISMETFEKLHDLLGTRDIETVREVVVKDKKIMYFPIWRITSRFKGLVYDSFVCAATGRFLYGTAPQSMRTRATSFSISYSIIAFLTSGCIISVYKLFKLVENNLETIVRSIDVMLLLASIPLMLLIALLAAIAAYGWDKFRYNPEVIKTPASVTVHSVGKFNDTWLDKLHKATLENLSHQFEGMLD